MPYPEQLHPRLQPMRLASRNGRMYVGPCPFCADGGDDRFHVWMEASAGRPAERYWCRVCNQSGLLKYLGHEQRGVASSTRETKRPQAVRPHASPDPAHIPFYRQLYQAVALWAHSWLLDPCHPDPRAYLHQRGLSDKIIGHYVLGVTLGDAESLVAYLRETCPEAFPYAEAAGLVVTDEDGRQRTHWNLRGRLLFPYIAGGEVVDLRTRTYDGGKGYRSLGPYVERGATFPFGWDTVRPGTKTVIIAEAEFKALAALQAFHAGALPCPTLGQPGLTLFREAWAEQLAAQGVEEVVLCYDSQPRTLKEGAAVLAPEEQWSLRHGLTCAAVGLRVRVARLPLATGETKAEIDTFLLQHGAARFQQLIATAPPLQDYHRSFDRAALERYRLPPPSSYPLRRERPTRLRVAERNATGSYTATAADETGATLTEARSQIADLVEQHATSGAGMLVLAHPPGTGKGFNTALGLREWMRAVPTDNEGGGFLVWTAQRKAQLHDQSGIELIPLAGRHQGNCRKLPEAMALTQKGYSVKDALCMRRCPFVDRCAYLRQFGQEGDFFASTPLLKATGWWERAGVVVLDEFDPASLINHIQLDSADLAAMSRGHAKAPAVQAVLRWVALALATTTDRGLCGTLFLDELDRQARSEGACLRSVLATALGELPPEEERNLLPGLPNGATLADYQALPPSYTATLFNQLAKELRHREEGRRVTSRLEARGGRLDLYARVEHLIQKLARADQPKIILDATANAELLRAIFPTTPVRVERPQLSGAARVVQVVGRDWAKSSLKRRSAAAAAGRHERWVDDVASHVRPGSKTLVVCTLEREEELRAALADRGYDDVVVAHYGALRGSNAYKGYDVILAQVYHPNLDAVVREGRALFADDGAPLDERVVVAPRLLRDAIGATWRVQVPTFADARLAALLEQRREAELLQCALRGRPFDHPDVQITLLFSLPVPGLQPTVIVEAAQRPESNVGREVAIKARLCAAAQQLLDQGVRVIDVGKLAKAARASTVTTRRHWAHVAARLHLQPVTRRRATTMPNGGVRHYERMVLICRGRAVPPATPPSPTPPDRVSEADDQRCDEARRPMSDQARKKPFIARLIARPGSFRCPRRSHLRLARRSRTWPPPDP